MTTDLNLNAVALSTAVPSAAVLRVRRQLLGGRRDSYLEVPGRPGAWRFSEQPGDRELTVEINVAGTSFATLRSALRDLAEWADTPAGPVRLIVDDEPDRYYVVMLAEAPDVEDWLRNGDVELHYRTDPYSYAVSTSSAAITATGGSPKSGTFVAADVIGTYPVIELTPTNGTLTGFELDINDDILTWSDQTITSGNTVTISSISSTVTLGVNTDVSLTGAYTDGSVTMSTALGEFGLVVPGTNSYTLTWTGTATTVRLTVTWRRRHR